MRRGRLVAMTVLVGGVAFGFWGGEYGTPDWFTLKREITSEQATLDRLYVEIDSLQRLAEAMETDSAVQERVARERFGMLRSGELLFRVEPVDSARADTARS